MKGLMEEDDEQYDQSDMKAYARHSLAEVQRMIQREIANRPTRIDERRIHLQDISERIEQVFDNGK